MATSPYENPTHTHTHIYLVELSISLSPHYMVTDDAHVNIALLHQKYEKEYLPQIVFFIHFSNGYYMASSFGLVRAGCL